MNDRTVTTIFRLFSHWLKGHMSWFGSEGYAQLLTPHVMNISDLHAQLDQLEQDAWIGPK